MEKLKVVSLFCGCGGTDLGLLGGFSYLGQYYEQLPVEIIYANDIDEKIADIFDANFKIKCVVEDIRNIKPKEIPEHDILTGGFPCQSFSIVAQNPPRLGYKDEKGKLFFEMCKILREKKPKSFVAENVKGILSANNGKTFPLIIKEFENCGYIVSWQLLHAADYGVPQRRERVFIVGIRKDLGNKYIAPEKTVKINKGSGHKEYIPLKKVLFPHNKVPNKYFFSEKAHAGLTKANPAMNKGRAQDIEKPCNTVGAHLAKVSLNSTDPVLKVNGKYRRFIPREVARIQSFPDSFKLVGPETVQYKALGNAIPPVLMWHVAKRLLKVLEGNIDVDTRTSKEKRSHNMSRIRSQDTVIERILSRELKSLKLRHKTNVKSLPGKPDIVFSKKKIAVFCDSDFWHGKGYKDTITRIKSNKKYWTNKIMQNIQRDRKVNKNLKKLGWKVLRFWENDIKKDARNIANSIKKEVSP